MPSEGEGFGIVFLEAMACGKPVLAGNKDGSVDLLLNEKLGALVDQDDVQEIARTLVAILQRTTEKRQAESQGAVVSSPPSQASQPPDSQLPASISKPPASISDLPASISGLRLPDIMFDPEALRARVIEEFGFDAFKKRLSKSLRRF